VHIDSWEDNPLYHITGWIYVSGVENSAIPAFYPVPEPIKWSPDGVYAWPTADGSQSSAIEETPESATAVGDETGIPELQDGPEPQGADGLDEDPDIGDLIITIVAVLIIVTTLSLTVYRRNKRL